MPAAIKIFQGDFEYFKIIEFFKEMNFSKTNGIFQKN